MEIEQLYYEISYSPNQQVSSELRLKRSKQIFQNFIDQLIELGEGQKITPLNRLIEGNGDYFVIDTAALMRGVSSKVGTNLEEEYSIVENMYMDLGYARIQGDWNDKILLFRSENHTGYYAGLKGHTRVVRMVEHLISVGNSYVSRGIVIPFRSPIEVTILLKDVVFKTQSLSTDLFESLLKYINRNSIERIRKEYDQNYPHYKETHAISPKLLVTSGKNTEKDLRIVTPRFMMINLYSNMGIVEQFLAFLDNVLLFLEEFRSHHKRILNNPEIQYEDTTPIDIKTEDELDGWIRGLRADFNRIDNTLR